MDQEKKATTEPEVKSTNTQTARPVLNTQNRFQKNTMKVRARRPGRDNKRNEKNDDEFDHKIINIRRVTRMYKGGRRMRLSVFRSNKFIYAQVIDDEKGHTLAAAKGKDAREVGAKVAEAAIAKKVKKVAYDRGNYRYHGKVKILADAARAKGLEF